MGHNQPPILCQNPTGASGDHPAQRVPDGPQQGKHYVSAQHGAAWVVTCAGHSGICHDACWPAAQYPALRDRVRDTR